jgi:hypothetical protein
MKKITTALESHLEASHGEVSSNTKALLDVVENRINAYREAVMVLLVSCDAQNPDGIRVSLQALRILVNEDCRNVEGVDPDGPSPS